MDDTGALPMDLSEQSNATGRVMKRGRQGRMRVKEKTVKEQEQQREKRRPIIIRVVIGKTLRGREKEE